MRRPPLLPLLLLSLSLAPPALAPSTCLAATSLALPDGRYHVTATIEACGQGACAVIDKRGREEMTLKLEPSGWDESLRSIAGLRASLVGRVRKMTLTLEEAPKLFRDEVEHLASPPPPYRKL